MNFIELCTEVQEKIKDIQLIDIITQSAKGNESDYLYTYDIQSAMPNEQ